MNTGKSVKHHTLTNGMKFVPNAMEAAKPNAMFAQIVVVRVTCPSFGLLIIKMSGDSARSRDTTQNALAAVVQDF